MSNMTVAADLSDEDHFPTNPAYSDLHPDLVAFSDQTKASSHCGTVCFETNFKGIKGLAGGQNRELTEKVDEND